MRTNAVCQYETEINETRRQALLRRHDELQTQRQTTNDSLAWLASQPTEVMSDAIQQLQDVRDPADELYAIVSAQRHQQLWAQQGQQVASPSAALPWPTDDLESIPTSDEQSFAWPSVEDWLQHIDRTGSAPRSQLSSLSSSEQESHAEPLPSLRIRFWTTVPITDELATALIGLYLRVEQPFYGFVDANLLVRDLLSQKTTFCSPLVVNCILLWTCVSRYVGNVVPGLD